MGSCFRDSIVECKLNIVATQCLAILFRLEYMTLMVMKMFDGLSLLPTLSPRSGSDFVLSIQLND